MYINPARRSCPRFENHHQSSWFCRLYLNYTIMTERAQISSPLPWIDAPERKDPEELENAVQHCACMHVLLSWLAIHASYS